MSKRNVNFNNTAFFPKNTYEIVFSVFMVGIAYLSRYSEHIIYPRILYFFLFLMFSNLLFNCLVSKYKNVKVGYVNLLALLNITMITGILINSGSSESYFWVLYLLPLFTVALIVDIFEVGLVLFLISVILAYFYSLTSTDVLSWVGFFIKILVLTMSSAVIYRTAKANKILEAEIVFKREQVDILNKEMMAKDNEIVQVESMVEMGKIISGLVHDLGNVVSVILLSSEILHDSESNSKKDVKRIMGAAQLAKGMLSNVFQIIRNEKYSFEVSDIKIPVENAMEILKYQAKQKDINIELSFENSIPQISISKIHIERIVINSLLNSISLMQSGGNIKVKVFSGDECVVLKIEDEGPGFPSDIIEKGIRAFHSGRKEKGGTGLGLFVCDQIVKEHGGSMRVSNGSVGGGVLEFKFPLKKREIKN